MNTKLMKQHEQDLRAYSVLVEFWDDEASDTHELLGYRELLHNALGELSTLQRRQLSRVDDAVLRLVDMSATKSGWDVVMLRDTAQLIRNERARLNLHVA